MRTAFRAGCLVNERLQPVSLALRFDLRQQVNRCAVPARFAMHDEILARPHEVGKCIREHAEVAGHGQARQSLYAAAILFDRNISAVTNRTSPGGVAAIVSFNVRNRKGTLSRKASNMSAPPSLSGLRTSAIAE